MQAQNAVYEPTEESARINRIRDTLNAYQSHGGTFKAISDATGVSRPAISMLANKGMALPDDKLTKIEGYLRHQHYYDQKPQIANGLDGYAIPDELTALEDNADPRMDMDNIPAGGYHTSVAVYPTDDYKKIMGWCGYVYKHRKIGAMIGYPGSGKTTILREYARQNPAAHYIECWSSMTMNDLLDLIADAAGMTLKGRVYQKEKQLMDALNARTDIMLLLDESEYLKKWNVEKFDTLRKIWDNTGTPVVFCGTPELVNILTRGTGKDNCAQLYRRILKIRLTGIAAKEAENLLRDYNIDPAAASELVRCATDHKHGGIGNMAEILQIALESAEGGQVDLQLVEDAKGYKLMY